MRFVFKGAWRATVTGLLFLLAGAASPGRTEPLITQTVGTGSNLSYFVLDFQDNTPNPSYAFGYRYDGAKTGGDLVDAFVRDAGLGATFGSFFQPNDFVIGFAYDGHARPAPGQSPPPDFFWSYWTGTNGTDWTTASVGLRQRTLTNGSWDGWSWTTFDPATFDPVSAPRTPQAQAAQVIPEPGTAFLAGAAVLGLLGTGSFRERLRRRRSC